MTVDLARAVLRAEELGYLDELLTLMGDYYADSTDYFNRKAEIIGEAVLTLVVFGLQ